MRVAVVVGGLFCWQITGNPGHGQGTAMMPATPQVVTNAAPAPAPVPVSSLDESNADGGKLSVPSSDTNWAPLVPATHAAAAPDTSADLATNTAPVPSAPTDIAPRVAPAASHPPTAPVALPSAQAQPGNKDFGKDLVFRFDSCVFDTPQFPSGSFVNDAMVRQFLGPVQVDSTFYNAQFQQVQTADAPGRYGAVVHIKLGDGTELSRFITLYCARQKLLWTTTNLGLSMTLPPEWGIDPKIARSHRLDIEWGVKSILKTSVRENSQLAIVLAGLSEMKPNSGPEVYRNGWESRDAAWWFALKAQLGIEKTYPYLAYLPDGYDSQPEKRWPLILFLHGSGERGDSLPKINAQGLPKLIAQGKKFEAVIISPQCPDNGWWEPLSLAQLLDEVSTKYRVDPDRICVTGLSMGGFGTWALALAYPERFAAIVPICGGGDPLDAARLRKLPTWAFHGGKDDRVPTRMSIDMVKAIRAAGGHAHLTIFPNDGHDSWTDAYNTPALYTWLLAQKRGHLEVAVAGVPTALPGSSEPASSHRPAVDVRKKKATAPAPVSAQKATSSVD